MSSTAELSRETAPPPAELDEDAIRAAMEAALNEEGRSLLRVAPEMGLKYGTVSSWRGGKYQGDTQRVAAAVHAWLNSRTARKQARAMLPPEPGFVMTKTASRIWEVLEFAQFTPTIGVVAGEAGVGKTLAFKGYQSQFPNTVWIATMQPFHNRIYPMLQQIGVALGIGRPGRTFDLGPGSPPGPSAQNSQFCSSSVYLFLISKCVAIELTRLTLWRWREASELGRIGKFVVLGLGTPEFDRRKLGKERAPRHRRHTRS